jgi:hypothetical protein
VIGWGGATTILGGLFSQYKAWIGRIGGLVRSFSAWQRWISCILVLHGYPA